MVHQDGYWSGPSGWIPAQRSPVVRSRKEPMDRIGHTTKGLDALKHEVLGTPTCTACGACVGFCPYIISFRDRVAGLEGCRKEEGRCYRFCPRSASGAGEGDRRGPRLLWAFAGDVRYAGPSGPRGADRARSRGFAGAGRPARRGRVRPGDAGVPRWADRCRRPHGVRRMDSPRPWLPPTRRR